MIGEHGTDSTTHASSSHTPSFYELLDVPTHASRLQIRESYIRLKHTYAIGSQALYSLVSDEEANLMMEQIEEAYRVLDDEMLRQDYDNRLGLTRESRGHEYNANPFTHGELVQTKARRTLDGPEEEEELGIWNHGAAEAPRTPSRVNTAFTKIRKVASNIHSPEFLQLLQTVQEEAKLFDGKTLVRLREALQVNQNEIQERTKVSIEYIKALENNDFHKLPSLVYVRGFIKIYLQYFGIKSTESLVDAYTEKYKLWADQNKSHSS